uniref:U4-Lycotoxin-Lsp1a_1 n=1 Tax=Lycosa sp. SGP-2016 TaxID=1905177 RepID=A0A482ZJH7_9ARAC
MKTMIFAGLVLFAIISFIEVEAESGRACLAEYAECVNAPGNCCSNLSCDCYGRFKDGKEIGRNCFCLEKGVIYKREK